MQAKAKMEMEGKVMERGLKKLEIGKGDRYATPFDAIMNFLMKGMEKALEEIGNMVEICPLQGKRLWCESTRGRGKGETSGYPLLVMKKKLGGEKRKKEK